MDNYDLIWSVDDDEEMSQAIGMMIKLLGFKFRSFDAARPAARALLQGERPALLLMDINMPEVSGLELLEFIRSRPALKKLPILMLSANATDTDVDLAVHAGAQGYLIKPVSLEELEHGLRSVLGYSRPADAVRNP
jgi:CheY-like chemotaxis protein